MKKIAFEITWRRFLHFSTYSLLIFSLACGSGGDQSESQGMEDLMDEDAEAPASMMSDDVLAEIIRGIPAPVELVALIKASGAD